MNCAICSFYTISSPCKSLCLQITADVSKITKNIQGNLTFIFIEPSGLFLNCYLAARWPTLNYCQGVASLTRCLLLPLVFDWARGSPRASQWGWISGPGRVPGGVWTGILSILSVILNPLGHCPLLNWIDLNWITLFKVSYVIVKLHNISHLLKVCLTNANRPIIIMTIISNIKQRKTEL